jgi:endogenous inhibitor of DNA gyrase (YacG/DUF329 family)
MADRPLCVYCRQRPVEARWRPFCSERCKMADLGRWLKGDYRVPGAAVPRSDGGGPDLSAGDEREDPIE